MVSSTLTRAVMLSADDEIEDKEELKVFAINAKGR